MNPAADLLTACAQVFAAITLGVFTALMAGFVWCAWTSARDDGWKL